MTEVVYHWALIIFGISAVLTFPVLLFVTVPYGRHQRAGLGPTMNAALGWMLMELPAVVVMLLCFLADRRHGADLGLLFLLLWEVHYVHRTFVFPWRRRTTTKRIPLFFVVASFGFNLANGYLNGMWLYVFGPAHDPSWLTDPRFIAGIVLFVAGLVINIQSDEILFRLRRPGESGYKVPERGLFRFVSCPNYLGELMEWCGFALCTWSPAAAVFALWTAANLVPRARAHHRWYRERFPDYPSRKIMIPYLF